MTSSKLMENGFPRKAWRYLAAMAVLSIGTVQLLAQQASVTSQGDGYLGAGPLTPEKEGRQQSGRITQPAGVSIYDKPVQGSPAEKAGLQHGDTITHLNGSPVESISDFERTIRAMGAGAEITLSIQRPAPVPNSWAPNWVPATIKVVLGQSLGPVLQAASTGNWDMLKQAVANGEYLDQRSYPFGLTALHYAAYVGREDVVKLLLREGADPNTLNKTGVSPIFYSAWRGNFEITRALLDNPKTRTDIIDGEGRGLMEWALLPGINANKPTIDLLLQHGMKLGDDLLTLAKLNDTQGIKNKLASGVNPNEAIHGYLSLVGASSAGNLEACKVLLAGGADPNKPNPNEDGSSALMAAVSGGKAGYPEVVKLLLGAKADPNYGNKHALPLCQALRRNSRACVAVLVAGGASLSAHDPDGWFLTPLALAIDVDCSDANSGEPYFTSLLLNAGADPNAVITSVVYGTAPNQVTHSVTAMMYAAFLRNGAVVKALLDHGARISAKSDQGYTALWYAQNGHNTRFDVQQCIYVLTHPDEAPSFQAAPNGPQTATNGVAENQAKQKLTKSQWRDKLSAHYGQLVQLNVIPNWRPGEFKKLMGDPDRTQTVGDNAFWYYDCSDGTIQLALNAPDLAYGIMQGHINDYSD